MTNICHIPAFPLNCYINHFWYTDTHTVYAREKILPSPTIDLMINFGEAFQVYTADGQPATPCTESWWVGLQSHYQIVEFPTHPHVLSVSFKPGGAYPFLQMPLSELQNQVVTFETLWGRLAAEIRERLLDVPTAEGRIGLLEQLLLARLRDVPTAWEAMQFGVGRMVREQGVISIRALSDEMGMSQKHLITQFNRLIGVSPKLFARIARFQHLMRTIDPVQSVDWAGLAYQLGYHDQSHFNKDLKAFTGLSPTDYLAQRRQVMADTPEHAQALQHLAIGASPR